MITKDYIKVGNPVHDVSEDILYIITEVSTAAECGRQDRETDELIYNLENLITKEPYAGICQHSAMTNEFLVPMTIEEVDLRLKIIEADAHMELSKAKRVYADIYYAISKWGVLKRKAEENNLSLPKFQYPCKMGHMETGSHCNECNRADCPVSVE